MALPRLNSEYFSSDGRPSRSLPLAEEHCPRMEYVTAKVGSRSRVLRLWSIAESIRVLRQSSSARSCGQSFVVSRFLRPGSLVQWDRSAVEAKSTSLDGRDEGCTARRRLSPRISSRRRIRSLGREARRLSRPRIRGLPGFG